MHAKLVKIGNSQGVRLPKAVIDQLGLGQNLDLEISDGAVVLRPAVGVRKGWAEAAAACHEAGEDRLGDWDSTTADFAGEWE